MDYFNDTLENKAQVIRPGEGEAYYMNGGAYTFKITSEDTQDQMGLYEIVLKPKSKGANLHYHRFMDETFIVLEGTLTLILEDGESQAKKGTIAYIPRFTPHGFKNDSEKEVKLLLIFNPAMKREGFFKGLHETLNEVPIDPSKYLKLYNKYDSFPVDVDRMLPIETSDQEI